MTTITKQFLAQQHAVLLGLAERHNLVPTARSAARELDLGVNGSDLPDIASAVSEAERTMGAASNRAKVVADICHALKKFERGCYGVCEVTGTQIGLERLEAIPWTRYSIEAQRQIEERAMRSGRTGMDGLFDEAVAAKDDDEGGEEEG